MTAPRRLGMAYLGLAVPLLAACAVWWTTQSGQRVLAHNPPAAQVQTPPDPQQPAAPPPPLAHVRVRADATRTYEGVEAGPAKACGLPEGELASRLDKSLDGPRIAAESSEDKLPVYGAKLNSGAVVLLANLSGAKAGFDVTVRLTRGVYSVERATFSTAADGEADRSERLQGVVLGGTGGLSKPGWLKPGEGVIYRFVNRSAQTASAFKAVKDGVRALRASRPSEYGKLMTPLRECEGNVGALSHGIEPGRRYDYLRYIHRALLTVAHAQSLCRNARGLGRIDDDHNASGLDGALDRLEENLTEMSAGCLGLVPNVTVTPDEDGKGGAEVVVALLNGGGRSLSDVKLGVTVRSGSVSPSDEAFFRAVQPGQTVRAAFTVRLDEQASDRDVTADVSYFAARAPAHVRLKALIGNQQP